MTKPMNCRMVAFMINYENRQNGPNWPKSEPNGIWVTLQVASIAAAALCIKTTPMRSHNEAQATGGGRGRKPLSCKRLVTQQCNSS